MICRVQCGYGGLLVPLAPDRVDEVERQDESAQAEQHPENPLSPMAAILRDVPQAVQWANLMTN